MVPILLTIAVFVALKLATMVTSATHLGDLLMPSRWLIGAVTLALITWLIRD
jgi:C4-dicarboxylate transporter